MWAESNPLSRSLLFGSSGDSLGMARCGYVTMDGELRAADCRNQMQYICVFEPSTLTSRDLQVSSTPTESIQLSTPVEVTQRRPNSVSTSSNIVPQNSESKHFDPIFQQLNDGASLACNWV
jgi:hypothetical protein